MKTFSIALLVMASLSFVVLGCSENSSNPLVSPVAGSTSETAVSPLAKGDVLCSVTGSCQSYQIIDYDLGYTLPAPKSKGGLYNTMSFCAIQHNNGTFTGNFVSKVNGPYKNNPDANWEAFKGRVIHVAVQDNIAKIVVEVTSGVMWDPAGTWWCIAFKDMGEGGKNAPPDLQSASFFTYHKWRRDEWIDESPQKYVDWTVSILQPDGWGYNGWVPIDNGNVQVH